MLRDKDAAVVKAEAPRDAHEAIAHALRDAEFAHARVELGADVELPLAGRLLDLEHHVQVGDRLVRVGVVAFSRLEKTQKTNC